MIDQTSLDQVQNWRVERVNGFCEKMKEGKKGRTIGVPNDCGSDAAFVRDDYNR